MLPADGVRTQYLEFFAQKLSLCPFAEKSQLWHYIIIMIWQWQIKSGSSLMVKISLCVRSKTFPCEKYYSNSYSKLHVQSYLRPWSRVFPEESWRVRGDVTCWALRQEITYWGKHVRTSMSSCHQLGNSNRWKLKLPLELNKCRTPWRQSFERRQEDYFQSSLCSLFLAKFVCIFTWKIKDHMEMIKYFLNKQHLAARLSGEIQGRIHLPQSSVLRPPPQNTNN